MPFEVPIPTPDGMRREDERNLTADELSTLSRANNAIRAVLSNRDPWAAIEFEGVTVAGFPLVWHPDDIEQLAIDGRLDFDEYYIHVPPS